MSINIVPPTVGEIKLTLRQAITAKKDTPFVPNLRPVPFLQEVRRRADYQLNRYSSHQSIPQVSEARRERSWRLE